MPSQFPLPNGSQKVNMQSNVVYEPLQIQTNGNTDTQVKNVNFLNVEYTWRHQALDNETKTFDNLKTRPVFVWNYGATLSNTDYRLK